MPRKTNTREFRQYVDNVVQNIDDQAGIFMPDSESYNLVNLLGAALADFAEELKQDQNSIQDAQKAQSFSKAIETLLTTEPPVKDNKKARNSVSQALATLQDLDSFLEENLESLLSFGERQTKNVQEAIEKGLPTLSKDLDLGLDLGLLENEEEQEEVQNEQVQDGPHNNEIIQENANDNVIQENANDNVIQENANDNVIQGDGENIINENNQPGQVNQENNVNNANNQNANQQDAQANQPQAPAYYTYEQFQQVKANAINQQLNYFQLPFLAQNIAHLSEYLDNEMFHDPNNIRDKLLPDFPRYTNAISTVMSDNLSKEAYDNAMQTLAGFPDFLAQNIYGETNFQRISNIGRQSLTYTTSDDLADELAVFGKLTGLPMNRVPQVQHAYNRVKDMPLPEPQAPQEEQVIQQNAPNLNQENIQNENPQIIQNENPENAQELNQPNNNNLNGNDNQNEQVNPEENVQIEEPVPVPPAVGPLHSVGLEEPATRLKTHFLSVHSSIPANSAPHTLSGDFKVKLPQFANAIAVLGTDGQTNEAYQQAKNTLLEMKPLLLRMGSTGNLGFDILTSKCGRVNGGCPNIQTLKDDLLALDGALQLGLDNLEQDLQAQQNLRGRKVDDLITASNPVNAQSLNQIPDPAAQRVTPLQHLNALHASLTAYDEAHPQAPRFTRLREHLTTVRRGIVSGADSANVNKILRNGTMAQELQAVYALLQEDDQTITEGIDKAEVRAQLQRAAAAMHINPNGLVPEEVFNQVRNSENAYIVYRDNLQQQQQQTQQIEQERFGSNLEAGPRYQHSLHSILLRFSSNQFQSYRPEAKLNAAIGLFSIIQSLLETNADTEQHMNRDEMTRIANNLAANPVFTNVISENMDELRQAVNRNDTEGAIKYIRQKQLEMADLPESLPAVFLPEAIDLTHDRIEKAKLAEFRQKPLPDKVHTLAQILAAREVVGSTRGDKHTLERGLGKKFFARTRELEQSKTFRDFVQRNEEQILRSLRGRTHGGAMEDLFKSYVLTRPNIPDDIPDRFMPTALERIEALQKAIRSNSFRNLELREKKGYYAELMATRLAVNSVRNSKSSLNFQLNGEALAKAREAILSDPDMARALGDRGMFDAAKTGHGGQMEEIAGKYNCKDVLKENMPPRYQPTVKEWIQSQLRKLSDANLLENDADRQAAAAKIFVALETYGDNQNVRIGQNGPSAGDLNTRAQNLANDQIYKSICMMGGLASSLDLSTARNPLRTLKNTFTTSLNAAQNKPLGGSFTQLSPARNQAQNQQPAAPAPVNPAQRFEQNKALLAGHMQAIQNNQNSEMWRKLNARTVQRALAEIAVCSVPNQNGALNEETLKQKSTTLMESKEWQSLFAQKNTQQLQELVTNAEDLQHCIQTINNALVAAQPQPVQQVQQIQQIQQVQQGQQGPAPQQILQNNP